jgi:hypothetical protein
VERSEAEAIYAQGREPVVDLEAEHPGLADEFDDE